jgi:hypothetical protein
MYYVFEVPANHQIHVGDSSYSNVGCVVARSRPYYPLVKVSVSEPLRLRRRAHDLDLLQGQVRQYVAHRVRCQLKFVKGDVGNDKDKLSLPNLFEEPTLSVINSLSKQPPNTDVSA